MTLPPLIARATAIAHPASINRRFTSRLHDERLAAWMGTGLGVAFLVCFATGVLSHLVQNPPAWFAFPPRPAGLYRVTQGLHVATGIATVPLLLAKLWVVYPHLYTWPPVRSIGHAVERLSLLMLVGGSCFLLFSGVANIARWYPYPLGFTAAHYAMAWLTMGALVAHIGAKAGATRSAYARQADPGDPEPTAPPASPASDSDGLSRRGLLLTLGAAMVTVTVATVGQTVRPFERLSLLSPRRPSVGPQGLPVNKSAEGARVTNLALDPAYRLVVRGRGVKSPRSFSIADLRQLPQTTARLPISCVEGWSAEATWTGVAIRDLMAAADVRPRRRITVRSMQPRGSYRSSVLTSAQAADPDALLALDLDGEPLHIDHGYPLRLIAPNRPGVLQTKWVNEVVV